MPSPRASRPLTRLVLAAAAVCSAVAAHAADAPAAVSRPVVAPAVATLGDATPERRVSSPVELADVLQSDFAGRVVIPRDVRWEMKRPCGARDELGRCYDTPIRDLPVKSGVQIVGERGALASRPLLFSTDRRETHSIFRVTGNDVRIEGLQLRGPQNGDRSKNQPYAFGVTVVQDPEQQTGRRIVIADNEMHEWPGAGVSVEGTVRFLEPPADYTGPRMRPEDAGLVRIERNYLHHNMRDSGGYGVVLGGSAYATIEGNVFDYNRHAISADGLAYKGYVARFNYVLEGGHTYGNGYWGQHFDVHGIGTEASRAESHYDGGPAGEFFDVSFNTFRGEQNYGGFIGISEKTRAAFELRGRPSIGARFHDNVLAHDDAGEAIRLKAGEDRTLNAGIPATFRLTTSANRYDADYTREIAAGDFDGDRRTDVFVATGTAWFISRAGVRPWELLHRSTKRTGELAFADIDNDGVTDVLYRDGAGRLGYLRRGTGPLVPLTTLPVPIGGLRFGDFDADRRTDMFFTRNGQWRVWHGRTRAWTNAQTSRLAISELLFGNFDAVPGTDVAASLSTGWSASSSATGSWTKFNRRLTNSLSSAVAADFNGDGRTDIAFGSDRRWQQSVSGRGPLVPLRTGSWAPRLRSLLIGRFGSGINRDQVLSFDPSGRFFDVWRGLGTNNSLQRHSMQAMR